MLKPTISSLIAFIFSISLISESKANSPVKFGKDTLQVSSVETGQILLTGQDKLNKDFILIDHFNGYFSFYAHLNEASSFVKKGDFVAKGHPIGHIDKEDNTIFIGEKEDLWGHLKIVLKSELSKEDYLNIKTSLALENEISKTVVMQEASVESERIRKSTIEQSKRASRSVVFLRRELTSANPRAADKWKYTLSINKTMVYDRSKGSYFEADDLVREF